MLLLLLLLSLLSLNAKLKILVKWLLADEQLHYFNAAIQKIILLPLCLYRPLSSSSCNLRNHLSAAHLIIQLFPSFDNSNVSVGHVKNDDYFEHWKQTVCLLLLLTNLLEIPVAPLNNCNSNTCSCASTELTAKLEVAFVASEHLILPRCRRLITNSSIKKLSYTLQTVSCCFCFCRCSR